MGEGVEERNGQYCEVMHAIANEAPHEILPNNIDMVGNVEEDEVVEVEMTFSMFHERCYLLIYGNNTLVKWVVQ